MLDDKEKLLVELIKADPSVIANLGEAMTPEICLEVLRLGHADSLSENQRIDAVQINGYAIKFVAEDLRTKEVCLAAIQTDGDAQQFLSPLELERARAYQTELAEEASQYTSSPHAVSAAQSKKASDMNAPHKKQYTLAMLHASLQKDLLSCGTELERQNVRAIGGREICDLATAASKDRKLSSSEEKIARAYGYQTDAERHAIDRNMQAQRLKEAQASPFSRLLIEDCITEVQRNEHGLYYIMGEDQRTPEVLMAAVEFNGRAIRYIFNDERTPEMCHAAVQQYKYAIDYLTPDEVTRMREYESQLAQESEEEPVYEQAKG